MDNKQKNKNSAAKIKANNKWIQTNYKRMQISTTPEQADYIRETAKKYNITIVQLILNSIKLFEENAERLPAEAATPSGTAGADTVQPEQAQPEQDPTKSPMKSGKTAGTQPEQDTEEETENEIETEETTEEEAEDIPEELKAVRAAWARMGAFNEKITAERKRREAEER